MSEKQEQKNEDIREFGQVALNNNRENNRISLLTIIGEIVNTPIGNAVLSYGTWGELCPIVAMALLLSTRTTIQSAAVLAIFAAIAVAMALISSRLKGWKRVEAFFREGAETTQQTVVRATMLLLVALTALSAVFNLDIVLGAFAAGFILRYIIPEGSKSLERKLDGLAFGFFIPLFFIVSGARIDLGAVGRSPDLLIFFIVLLLLIRALPIFVALSVGRRRTLSRSARITVAIYCTTALPIIVAVPTVAQQAGAMSAEIASVLVCAGAVTVLVMPALASATTRLSDTHVVDLAKEVAAKPSDISTIVKHRAELVRLLARARALIDRDDPDLIARIKPLVARLAKEEGGDDRDVQLFIDELSRRYKESGASAAEEAALDKAEEAGEAAGEEAASSAEADGEGKDRDD